MSVKFLLLGEGVWGGGKCRFYFMGARIFLTIPGPHFCDLCRKLPRHGNSGLSCPSKKLFFPHFPFLVNFMVASNEHAFWPSGKWLPKRFILVHVRIILMNCLCQGHPSVNAIDHGHCNAHVCVCVCVHICVFFCTCPALLILIQILSPQEAMHLTFG